jgi:hypothetical protein
MQLKLLIVALKTKEPYFEVIRNVPSLSRGLKQAPHISWMEYGHFITLVKSH